MKASEAAAMSHMASKSKETKQEATVEALVKYIEEQIEKAATSGLNAITNPLEGLRLAYSPLDREKAYTQLEQNGFVVAKTNGDVRIIW